jgi:hypothetical protein
VRRKLAKTGVTVNATSSEAKSETINVMPSGRSILPSIPERKNKGAKAMMMIRVACMMEDLISREAL